MTYHVTDRRRVHADRPWSQFSYANRLLKAMVFDFVRRTDPSEGAVLLDFGCADSQYRGLIPPQVRYIGADLHGNVDADVHFEPGQPVPLPAESVDLVLSTQVLEHVLEPESYLRECHRLLKPSGSLVLSTHGLMYYHADPDDYWRWTTSGLQRVLDRCGFMVVEQRGLLGLAAAALQIFQDATFGYVPGPIRRPYALVMQTLIRFADRRYDDEQRRHNCWTIAVIARKQSP
jgi:SAM-dependent methyltransferase